MAKVAMNEQLIGYNTNGKKLIKAHFICDSQGDLPVQTEYDDYILYLGCTAHCITEHTDHELKSGGVWMQTVQPPADYDLLTNRPQINGNVLTGNQSGNDLGLQNTLSFDSTPTHDSVNPVTSGGIWTDQQRQDTLQLEDRAALVELVDGGAKNKFTKASGSVSSSSPWLDTSGLTNILAGVSYVMSFENLESSDTERTTIQIRFSNSSYEFYIQCPKGQNVNVSFTSQQDITAVRIYKSDTYAHGDGKTMSFSGAMICTATAYAVSTAFVPYRPSWQEMWDAIQALQ